LCAQNKAAQTRSRAEEGKHATNNLTSDFADKYADVMHGTETIAQPDPRSSQLNIDNDIGNPIVLCPSAGAPTNQQLAVQQITSCPAPKVVR